MAAIFGATEFALTEVLPNTRISMLWSPMTVVVSAPVVAITASGQAPFPGQITIVALGAIKMTLVVAVTIVSVPCVVVVVVMQIIVGPGQRED